MGKMEMGMGNKDYASIVAINRSRSIFAKDISLSNRL